MNRSYSKIRHIQESNQRLENRLLESQDDEGKNFHNMLKTLFKKGGINPPNKFKRRMSNDITVDYIRYIINKEKPQCIKENDKFDWQKVWAIFLCDWIFPYDHNYTQNNV